MDQKADILSSLEGMTDYASEYEKRKASEESTSHTLSPEQIKQGLANMQKKSIADEIAETLRKIKEQEAVDAARFAEERKRKEEKKQREAEMKAKIQEELEKIRKLEAEQAEKIRRQEEKREVERKKIAEEVRH